MLTKDSKTVLYRLYKEYLARKKNNAPKIDAKSFGSASMIRDSMFPDWILEDVEESLRELGRNGFLNNLYADDTVCEMFAYRLCHHHFGKSKKNIFLSVADFISKFTPL